jgi:hypothetical protein
LDVETGWVNCCGEVSYRITIAINFTESLGNDL